MIYTKLCCENIIHSPVVRASHQFCQLVPPACFLLQDDFLVISLAHWKTHTQVSLSRFLFLFSGQNVGLHCLTVKTSNTCFAPLLLTADSPSKTLSSSPRPLSFLSEDEKGNETTKTSNLTQATRLNSLKVIKYRTHDTLHNVLAAQNQD